MAFQSRFQQRRGLFLKLGHGVGPAPGTAPGRFAADQAFSFLQPQLLALHLGPVGAQHVHIEEPAGLGVVLHNHRCPFCCQGIAAEHIEGLAAGIFAALLKMQHLCLPGEQLLFQASITAST